MTEMIARLAPGATVAQARAEVAGIAKRAHEHIPNRTTPAPATQVTLTPLQEVLGQNAQAHALAADGRGRRSC